MDTTSVETVVVEATDVGTLPVDPTPAQPTVNPDLTLAHERASEILDAADAKAAEIMSIATAKSDSILNVARLQADEIINRVESGLPLERRGRPKGVKNGEGKKVFRKALVQADGTLRKLGAGRPPKDAVTVLITPANEHLLVTETDEQVDNAVAVG